MSDSAEVYSAEWSEPCGGDKRMSQDYPAPALPATDATGYAQPLLTLKEAMRRFEESAPMVASGQKHLAEATRLAHQAVIAARQIAAWCHTKAFEVPSS